MTLSELNEDIKDQLSDLLENLQKIKKFKNKVTRILSDKIVIHNSGKVVIK